MRTLKVLGALLTYPDEPLLAALGEMEAILVEENRLPPAQRDAVLRMIGDFRAADPWDLQEDYVARFDRTRSLSLHLFEHIHGESRARGQAMVDLAAMYEAQGLAIDAKELPDYLPMFLEFLSLVPEAQALDLLAETAHVIAALAGRLKERGSGHHAVFAALQTLAGDPSVQLAAIVTPAEEADSADALDKEWEDQEVTFGAGAAMTGCPASRDVLARM